MNVKYRHRMIGKDSSQMNEQARKLEVHVHKQWSIQGNFRPAVDALLNCNTLEH
jgi:hypothetical protein